MFLLELLKTILLGIVEGITEWLPISSTGYLILLNNFIKLDVSEEFWDMFEVVIQLGGDPGGGAAVLEAPVALRQE